MKALAKNIKISGQGIVHFWDLPHKIHVTLDVGFRDKLMKEFMQTTRTKYNANKKTGISRTTIKRYANEKNSKIKIDFLMKIIDVINDSEFNLNSVEKNIKWIGDFRSHGVIKPKLPFNFNSREGARLLAAICNEGWISDGLYYSNSDQELRNSVKKDTCIIFGGNKDTVRDWIKEKDQYLAFPSVVRDVLNLLLNLKG